MRPRVLAFPILACSLLSLTACGPAPNSQVPAPDRNAVQAGADALTRPLAAEMIRESAQVKSLVTGKNRPSLGLRPGDVQVRLVIKKALDSGLLSVRLVHRRGNLSGRSFEVAEWLLTDRGARHLRKIGSASEGWGQIEEPPDESRVLFRYRAEDYHIIREAWTRGEQLDRVWYGSIANRVSLAAPAALTRLTVTGIAGTEDRIAEFEGTLERRIPEEIVSCGCVLADLGVEGWLSRATLVGIATFRKYDDGWRVVNVRSEARSEGDT